MPMYDFKCGSCGFVASRLVRVMDAAKGVSCQKCHKHAERILSMPTAPPVLKGTGYYQTDFKGKST